MFSGDRVRLFRGAIASGKTIAGAVLTISRRLAYPGTGQLVGGPSWDQVRDGAQVTLTRLGMMDFVTYENKNEHIWELSNGSWLQFRSLSDPDVIRGIEWHDIWIDEIAQCPPAALDISLGRNRLPYDDPEFVPTIWGTTTPRGMDWTLDVFGERGKTVRRPITDEDGRHTGGYVDIAYGVTHSTIFDNRTNLPAGYIEGLQAQYEGTPFYDQELLGKYTAFEGLVYSMFNRATHVQPAPCDLRQCTRVVVGVDFGGATPTALELVGERSSGRAHVYDEMYMTGATVPDITLRLQAWERRYGRTVDVVACDGSEPVAIATLQAAGFPAVAADKSRLTGIKHVQQRFMPQAGGPGLTIAAECTGLLGELGMYMWASKRDGETKIVRRTDTPIDHHGDACLVAGTLVRTDHGDVPIEMVAVGERVLTRRGYRAVTDAAMTSPSAEVYTAMFSTGGTLTGTGNHPVWIDGKGFTPLDALRYGDILTTCKLKPTGSKRSSLTGSSSDAGWGEGTLTTTRTTGTVSAAFERFIKKSGKPLTAPSRRDLTFTTLTSIPKTMISTTSCALRRRSIMPSTLRSLQMSNATAIGYTSVRSDRSRKRGMHPWRAVLGTVNTDAARSRSAFHLPRSVTSAVRYSSRWLGECQTVSARTPVSRSGGGLRVLTTKRGSARHAGISSQPTATQRRAVVPVSVVRVSEQIERQAVYNLTVDEAHEYFANGILVSNCDALRYAMMALGQWRSQRQITLPSGRRVMGTMVPQTVEPEARRSPLMRVVPTQRQ